MNAQSGMEGKRVLFLDVDGVLNNEAAFLRRQKDDLDPDCLKRFFELVERTGCTVVLSSSWRNLTHCEERLERNGVTKTFHPSDGRTPRLNTVQKNGIWISRIRGDEIHDWLARHPEVSIYAIVDDESDMRPEQEAFFVQTDFKTGLTDKHVERLVAILGTAAGRSALANEKSEK